MRRPIIVIIAVIVVVVAAIIIGLSLLNVNKFRPRIQAELESRLGRPVTLGEMHLRIFPLALRVDGIKIGQAPGWPPQPPLATAKEVYASAGLMSLLRGQPEIKDLTLDQPQIELIRNPQGVWNISSTPAPAQAPAQPAPRPAPKQPAPPVPTQPKQAPAVSFNRLQINDGQVAVTDQRAKAPRTVYNHIDLTVANFAPGKQFDFDLAAHFPGKGKERLAFNGKAGPLEAGNADIMPMSGHLSIEEVSLAGLNSVAAGSIPPNSNGVLSGTADISSQNENVACKGNLKLTDAVIRGAKLGYPAEAQYDVLMNRPHDEVQVRSGSIRIGPTLVNASGTVNNAVTPSALNLRLTTANASLAEISRLASLFGNSFNSSNQLNGSVSADLAVTGNSKAPQIQGNLSASSLEMQGLVLKNVKATCNMNNGVIVLSPVTAGLFGGQGSGAITVDTKPANPLCSVKTNLSGVDTNALLSSLSALKDTLYGSLSGNTNVNFTVAQNSDIARTLNGNVSFNVANGQLKHVNILSEISRIGRFLNGTAAAAGSGTALERFSGAFNITNGVATTNNLVAVLKEGSLSAAGSLNLASQALNMHLTAVLAKGTSSAVGGTGVGGFLNTALANNQGELVIPVLVTGTTAHPAFAPDMEAMAKMKINKLLPTTNDPTKLTNGALGSVLGNLMGQSAGQKNQQKKQEPQSPVNSLLQQLRKKKPH